MTAAARSLPQAPERRAPPACTRPTLCASIDSGNYARRRPAITPDNAGHKCIIPGNSAATRGSVLPSGGPVRSAASTSTSTAIERGARVPGGRVVGRLCRRSVWRAVHSERGGSGCLLEPGAQGGVRARAVRRAQIYTTLSAVNGRFSQRRLMGAGSTMTTAIVPLSGENTLWPPAPNPPSLRQLDDDVVNQFGVDLLGLIQMPLRGADISAQRHRLASQLASLASGDRATLERLRSYFIRRLHRPLPDMAAVAALAVSEQALRLLPHDLGEP